MDNAPQPPGDEGTPLLPAPLQLGKTVPIAGSSPSVGVGSHSQEFLHPPLLAPPSIFSQGAMPSSPAGVLYSLPGPAAASPSSRLVQTLPGSFPDIYDGDMKKWEEHFHSIQRAYKEFGKEDDFAIRVLTEDFTLPFPFAWPSEGEVSQQLAYDPADCAGFDFFLHPGQPIPRLLQPLHATTQAFFKKRRLEQLALSYATKASLAPSETSPPLRSDIMVITSMPCVSTTAPGETSFLLQEGKSHRNIQPAPIPIPSAAPMQPINFQFMSPNHHGPF